MSNNFKVQLLPKKDPRFIRWKESLKKRSESWSKGHTKLTHPSLRKTSETFKKKRIDNFKTWRKRMISENKIKNSWPNFKKDNDLAMLIGIVLGDGHIEKYERTEGLDITLGTDKPNLIHFVNGLVERVFKKKPSVQKQKSNCVKVRLYEKFISKRLNVPTGKRRYSDKGIPVWIWKNDSYLISCLRGLYEAEGSLCIHLPTCTYNFAFNNRNARLLNDVKRALLRFGLHPETRDIAIRIRRKNEVKYLSDLLSFRRY